MNNTINKLLLAGDKFMPEIHLRQLQFKTNLISKSALLTVLVDHLLNMNKEFNSLKKLETQTIYIKMN